MFGLLDLFGRSASLKALDRALRDAGLHPLVVPEAVKIAVVRLARGRAGPGKGPDAAGNAADGDVAGTPDAAWAEAAELLAYCMLGRAEFAAGSGVDAADRAERRVEAATAAGDSADARLILLALHAGIVAPDVADRLDVEDG